MAIIDGNEGNRHLRRWNNRISMGSFMPFSSAVSQKAVAADALSEIVAQLDPAVTQSPDLVVYFFTQDHARHAESLLQAIKEVLLPAHIIGCVAEAVVGTGQEIEEAPALSLFAGKWPADKKIHFETFELTVAITSEGKSLLGWPDGLVGGPTQSGGMILLGDPLTCPVDYFLKQVNEDFPGLTVVGGMASGSRGQGGCRLVSDRGVVRSGAVGVLLGGNVGMRTVVSQGCRPVGQPMIVTRSEGNIIHELGGKKPIQQLQEMWRQLPASEQRLFEKGLHLGIVVNEYAGEFRQGDFLIRNCGFVNETGALVVGDQIRTGQTVQFQVRDAESADLELRGLLEGDKKHHKKMPGGALMFTCNGRGKRFFTDSSHDAQCVESLMGRVPMAGFFAQGELGPVGGQNYIHGFTASMAFFDE